MKYVVSESLSMTQQKVLSLVMKGVQKLKVSLSLSTMPKEPVSRRQKPRGIFAIGPGIAGPIAKMPRGFCLLETGAFSSLERQRETGTFLNPLSHKETTFLCVIESDSESTYFRFSSYYH